MVFSIILIFNQSVDKKSAQKPYKAIFNIKLFLTAVGFCLIFPKFKMMFSIMLYFTIFSISKVAFEDNHGGNSVNDSLALLSSDVGFV